MYFKNMSMELRTIIVGFIVGCFMSFLMTLPITLVIIIGDWFDHSKNIARTWELINSPAMWLADIWINTPFLPPKGEIAWLVCPCITIIIQWIVLSLIISLIILCIKKNKHSSQKVDSED